MSSSWKNGSPAATAGISPRRSAKTHDDIFQTTAWRDLWAAVLYYVSLAAFFAIAGINISYFIQNAKVNVSSGDQDVIMSILVALGPAVLTSGLLSGTFLYLVYLFPEQMIHGCYLGLTTLAFALGGYLLFTGAVLAGIITILVGGLNLLVYFLWRKFIPFSGVLLRWTTRTLGEYPAMLTANFGIMFLLIAKFAVLALSLSGAAIMHQNKYRTDAYIKGTGLYSIFWFIWTEEILQNVSRVTSSGVFACRYFLGLNSPQAPNPTSESFKRATTYSFGSICFGSLLVAIISFLRFMLNTSDDRDSLGGAIVDCLLSILEDLLRYFNTYAFTQVAIYGKPYIEAAKATWNLVKSSGVGAIINDNLTGSVLGLGSLLIGISGGIVSLVTVIIYDSSQSNEIRLIAFIAGVVASSLIAWCSLNIINSGVTTFFVCVAEDSAALQRTDPETYQKLRAQYGFMNL